jgi:hypothetical protein
MPEWRPGNASTKLYLGCRSPEKNIDQGLIQAVGARHISAEGASAPIQGLPKNLGLFGRIGRIYQSGPDRRAYCPNAAPNHLNARSMVVGATYYTPYHTERERLELAVKTFE